jgi:hypothetical protein
MNPNFQLRWFYGKSKCDPQKDMAYIICAITFNCVSKNAAIKKAFSTVATFSNHSFI